MDSDEELVFIEIPSLESEPTKKSANSSSKTMETSQISAGGLEPLAQKPTDPTPSPETLPSSPIDGCIDRDHPESVATTGLFKPTLACRPSGTSTVDKNDMNMPRMPEKPKRFFGGSLSNGNMRSPPPPGVCIHSGPRFRPGGVPPPPPPPFPHPPPMHLGQMMGPPPPPPPPPPGMNQDCWGNVPPPPPPPGKRGKKMARDEIESVQGLMPPRGTTERVVRLSAVNTNRRAMLLHYAAAPFDLHENLWILKYGEANKWYTRPATSELERLRKFEDAGLGPDVRNWACHEPDCLHPAPSNMVKLQFGEVMGVADPDERQCWCGEFVEEEDTVCRFGKSCSKKRNVRDAISNELLVYLSVVEADKRDTDDDQDAADDMSFVGSTAKDDQCCDGSKIYKLEKTGSKNACAARAYQNAALRGWSTIFSCVIKGEVDLAKMSGGIKCFERVRNLGDLLGDAEGGKIKIFY